MQNISRHYYHLAGRCVHLLAADGEFCLLVRDGTEPVVLINLCLDVSDDLTKAREVDGPSLAMGYFSLDKGLVVTLDHSDIMDVRKDCQIIGTANIKRTDDDPFVVLSLSFTDSSCSQI